MLSLQIEKAAKSWRDGLISVDDQLDTIRRQCPELTSDVQALSHELHPSILNNLGLVMAVKGLLVGLCHSSQHACLTRSSLINASALISRT
jgi:signal transduction histidine kinase